MRTKTKLEATPPKAAPQRADTKRSRPSPKAGQVAHGSLVADQPCRSFHELMQLSMSGVDSADSHVWKQPTKTFKAGGEWTLGRAVRVWWDGEKRWYEGVVIRYDGNPNLLDSHGSIGPVHTISYDDGIYDENLSKELNDSQGRSGQALPQKKRDELVQHGELVQQSYIYGEGGGSFDAASDAQPASVKSLVDGAGPRKRSRSKAGPPVCSAPGYWNGERTDAVGQQAHLKRSHMVSMAANSSNHKNGIHLYSETVGYQAEPHDAAAHAPAKDEVRACEEVGFVGESRRDQGTDAADRCQVQRGAGGELCDQLIENVMSELLRMRLTVGDIPQRVRSESERGELAALMQKAQAQLKVTEEEVRRASEAAAGARCEESGHIKAAGKARASQEVERTKMRELLVEEKAKAEDLQDEKAILKRIEELSMKGDEARSALNVLEHMPAVTKTTQEHKQYEENLIRQKVRGQAAAVLMDAFQGFAAQAARSDKARAEAGARAQKAEGEHLRKQQWLTEAEQEHRMRKEQMQHCMAPMPYLADWIQAHRSRVGELAGVQSGSDGWKEEMARKLQTAIRQRLPQKVAAEAERITALKGQLKHLKAKEEEDETRRKVLSSSQVLLRQTCTDDLDLAHSVLLLGEGATEDGHGGKDEHGDSVNVAKSMLPDSEMVCEREDALREEGQGKEGRDKEEQDSSATLDDNSLLERVEVVLANLKTVITRTKDASAALKALKTMPASKKTLAEFKVLWEKMQSECTLYEQVSTRHKQLTHAVRELDENISELQSVQERLEETRQSIADLEHKLVESEAQMLFAREKMPQESVTGCPLVKAQEKDSGAHVVAHETMPKNGGSGRRPLESVPCAQEGGPGLGSMTENEEAGGSGSCDCKAGEDEVGHKRKADALSREAEPCVDNGAASECVGASSTYAKEPASKGGTCGGGEGPAESPTTPATRPRRELSGCRPR